MHMHTAIRAASFTQPPTQAKNLPLSNGRASADVIDLMGTVIPFARNTEVYGENEPAEYLYKVISGTVRTYKVLVDGRRQIGAFHVCGDVFGFETDAEHTFSAEAITDCKIAVIKRSALMAVAAVTMRLPAICGRSQPANYNAYRRTCCCLSRARRNVS